MIIEAKRLTCGLKKCGHVWDEDCISECAVELWTAVMKYIRCPKCGGKKILFGGEIKVPDLNPATLSIGQRADHWLKNGARGLSSEAIFEVMTGRVITSGHFGSGSYPLDPSDFGRCFKLLELIPEWKVRLHEVAERHPFWGPLVKRWDEMEILYREEAPSGKCPELYKLMLRIRKDIQD